MAMSLERVWAVLLQELYITRRSLEVIMDLPFFSIVSIVIFGFVSLFLTAAVDATAARYLLLGMLLWEIVRVTQYSTSVGVLWNIWSRNLSNMFVAPLSLPEYLLGQALSGLVKAALIFVAIALLARLVFRFDIFALGAANLVLSFVNLSVFAWSVGLVLLGLIFRYGTRIQALAWGLIFLFEPLTAALFPVAVLPPALQTVAYLLPPTYVFEAARAALADPSVDGRLFALAFVENLAYLGLAGLVFQFLFRRSRETGQFARNEG
jgi:ABC-2 type transport system permease protein